MKKLGILLIILLGMFVFLGCGQGTDVIETTDLSKVSIDSIVIGNSIESINLNNYTESDRYSGDYKYLFDEIIIGEANNKVNYLFSSFDEHKTIISLNGHTYFEEIHDVSKALGQNFKESWYDKDQGLKVHTYYDSVHNIKAEFIYVNNDNALLWIKLSRLK